MIGLTASGCKGHRSTETAHIKFYSDLMCDVDDRKIVVMNSAMLMTFIT